MQTTRSYVYVQWRWRALTEPPLHSFFAGKLAGTEARAKAVSRTTQYEYSPSFSSSVTTVKVSDAVASAAAVASVFAMCEAGERGQVVREDRCTGTQSSSPELPPPRIGDFSLKEKQTHKACTHTHRQLLRALAE